MASGDHACLVCDSDAERRSAMLEFVRAGVSAGEKVVFIHEHDGDWLLEDSELVAARDAGQLELRPLAGAYLATGTFDPPQMLSLLRQDVEDARAAGYSNYRVCGEMGWASPGMEALLGYEDQVDELLAETGAVALCHYDRPRFQPDTIREIQRLHPLVLTEGAGAVRPELAVEPGAGGELVLRGEVDVATRGSLEHSLVAARRRRRELRLDVKELEFIDAAGLRIIHSAGEQLRREGGELTLVRPGGLVRRLLSVLEVDRAVIVEEGT